LDKDLEVKSIKDSFSAVSSDTFFIATDNPFENAERFTKIHVNRYRSGMAPSISNLVDFYADRLGIKSFYEYRAVNTLARRADVFVVKEPAYHGKYHFLDVVAATANFLEQHQKAAMNGEEGFEPLTKKDMLLTLFTAIGHDLDHEGLSNPKSDKVFNEETSFQVMLPYMRAANFSSTDMAIVHAMQIATSPNGPNQYVKALTKANREGYITSHAELQGKDDFYQLEILSGDKKLAQMAAIVVDADLYGSSGAGYKAHFNANVELNKEAKAAGVNIDYSTLESSNFFLSNVVGTDGYASNVARKIAGGSLEALRNTIRIGLTTSNLHTEKLVNG